MKWLLLPVAPGKKIRSMTERLKMKEENTLSMSSEEKIQSQEKLPLVPLSQKFLNFGEQERQKQKQLKQELLIQKP